MIEKFEAECGKNEVIYVNFAQFGRMKVGRCVTKNYGKESLGCSKVLNFCLNFKN